MTQKELLYVEDAINHEQNIMAYISCYSSCIEDNSASTFLEDELKYHEGILKKLVNLLEDESNEW